MSLPLFPANWRDLWAGKLDVESTGAIFTKIEVVDLILDLVNYRPERGRLASLRVLEPSCGDGAFVSRVLARLVEGERKQTTGKWWTDPLLDHAITAADINPESLSRARHIVVSQLTAAGCPPRRAEELAQLWIVEADFLLEPWQGQWDICVGNPPYVRIESLPKLVLEQYRAQYDAMGDRADVYVAFIERALQLLSPEGRLSYIVANRWTKNAYGRNLRALISKQYHVRAFLDLAHTHPFLQDVSAYPCIVVLDKERGAPTYAATLEDIERATLDVVRRSVGLQTECVKPGSDVVRRFDSWYASGAPWITTSVDEHEKLTRMSHALPTLEQSAPGTKVGIGVATGADRVYLLRSRPDGVEADRLLPIAMPADVKNSGIEWSGRWLINPFAEDGSLVPLSEYAGLRAYLQEHGATLKARHVVKGRPDSWYRTIDRIWPELVRRAKLLMRDIQDPAKPTVGVDAPGTVYPHHNLYYVVSTEWPLHALQCLLRSRRVVSQVEAHSVAMRGGSIRWQAQVLRRLRVPHLNDVPGELLERMVSAGPGKDTELINALADEAYGAAE